MDKTDYGKIEERANALQENSLIEMGKKIKEAQDYQRGYDQGVEDLLRHIRSNIQNGH